jgi:peroxiredoxin Q/BCP
MIEEGKTFPAFSLPDQDGAIHTLDSLKGSPTILYFYPKDDTSGCTQESCEFRDLMPRFEGAKIFGVSPDGAKSHQKFIKKYNLNFPLLSDENKELLGELGIWVEKSMYGKKYMGVQRTTVLLDADGKVKKVWNKVNPAGHAEEVLAALAG